MAGKFNQGPDGEAQDRTRSESTAGTITGSTEARSDTARNGLIITDENVLKTSGCDSSKSNGIFTDTHILSERNSNVNSGHWNKGV